MVALVSPLHAYGERYFSVHMVQHLLLTLVAPPLLIAGVPSWLWRAMLGGRHVLPVTRIVLHPLVTNIQASWVKLGPAGVAKVLEAGANDCGGTLITDQARCPAHRLRS